MPEETASTATVSHRHHSSSLQEHFLSTTLPSFSNFELLEFS